MPCPFLREERSALLLNRFHGSGVPHTSKRSLLSASKDTSSLNLAQLQLCGTHKYACAFLGTSSSLIFAFAAIEEKFQETHMHMTSAILCEELWTLLDNRFHGSGVPQTL